MENIIEAAQAYLYSDENLLSAIYVGQTGQTLNFSIELTGRDFGIEVVAIGGIFVCIS